MMTGMRKPESGASKLYVHTCMQLILSFPITLNPTGVSIDEHCLKFDDCFNEEITKHVEVDRPASCAIYTGGSRAQQQTD